jgi:tight adherence protein B
MRFLMESNLFAASGGSSQPEQSAQSPSPVRIGKAPDYKRSTSGLFDHVLAFFIGAVAGFAIMYIFYNIIILSIIGAIILGTVNIFTSSQKTVVKRRTRLRVQFFDLLEAMSVAMRAGNPMLKSLQSARGDLVMIYPEGSDIIVELDIIISKFNNAVPLSVAFADLAKRSELEDINSFASIYATIEGKSSRADEIIRETQQIIADKMEIEMDIDTMMTAAKSEVNIMLILPLAILGVIGSAGAGFMDAIYTTAIGRAVATGGLLVFIACFIMARKFSNVKV